MGESETTEIEPPRSVRVSAGGGASETGVNKGGRVVGYARVSTAGQDHESQLAALAAAGVDEVVTETASGAAAASRPVRDALLAELRPGDALVVWRLDRLGRSMADTVRIVDSLARRGVGLRSLTEAVDTGTAAGRMVVAVLAGLAEMEREAIAERTAAGLAAARRRGARLGRPPALDRAGLQAVVDLTRAGRTGDEIASVLGVSRSTVVRARAAARERGDLAA